MKRFMLAIDVSGGPVETFGDIVGVVDALLDRLKLFAKIRPQGGGGVLRDDQGRVVGSWEIKDEGSGS
jgi:hypothetical protein